jgi:hypothetical protein
VIVTTARYPLPFRFIDQGSALRQIKGQECRRGRNGFVSKYLQRQMMDVIFFLCQPFPPLQQPMARSKITVHEETRANLTCLMRQFIRRKK